LVQSGDMSFLYIVFDEIQSISQIFLFSIEDISGSSGPILMQNSVLETLLVADYKKNLVPKLKFAENLKS
jgi:hypothetical protein